MNLDGCIFLEEGINFDFEMVNDCCILHNCDRGLPILLENYHGENIDWEKLFEIKKERVERQKIKTIHECEGCYHLKNYVFKGEKKISEFHFSHSRACNCKCIYCSKEYSKGPVNYNTYPIIKDLIEKGYYKSGGEATLQGGEPTLMQNFDELVHLFITNGTTVRVHTNGIRYSSTVYEALKNDKGSVVISLDSGDKKTYEKIKQVGSFDIVVENIKKYRSANIQNTGNVIIKYIIVPGYNDTISSIDKFFKLMVNCNINTVALDIELQYATKYKNKDVSKHIFLLVDYFKKLSAKHNINCIVYSFLSYVLKNRSIDEFKHMDKKFIFNLWVNYNKDKAKEVFYK